MEGRVFPGAFFSFLPIRVCGKKGCRAAGVADHLNGAVLEEGTTGRGSRPDLLSQMRERRPGVEKELGLKETGPAAEPGLKPQGPLLGSTCMRHTAHHLSCTALREVALTLVC